MVTTVGALLPGWRLATCRPLPRHPPAADLRRLGRINQIHDHHDVAEVTLLRRRHVDVAAIEIEAVHASAGVGVPARDQTRLGRRRYVVDADAALPAVGSGIGIVVIELLIDHHQAVGDPHLVRVRAGLHVERREQFRILRIAHIHDATCRAAPSCGRYRRCRSRPRPGRRRRSRRNRPAAIQRLLASASPYFPIRRSAWPVSACSPFRRSGDK